MRYTVKLTDDAAQDLAELYDFVAEHDSLKSAERLLDNIEQTIESLALFPERGSVPKELLTLGIREYRQTFFKPYRLIYRTVGEIVYVQLIADGRRDTVSLLARRMLGFR